MNYIILIAFSLASISILLGFIALLKQKTYLDSKTNQPTDVEVPLVGRLKTNYPALVFVFLGFCLAFYVVHKSLPQKEIIWKITFYLNGLELERFSMPAFTVKKIGTGLAFKSKVRLISIKARVPKS